MLFSIRMNFSKFFSFLKKNMYFCNLELNAKELESTCITLTTPGILLVSSKVQPIFCLVFVIPFERRIFWCVTLNSLSFFVLAIYWMSIISNLRCWARKLLS